jgi:hypothetical protein
VDIYADIEQRARSAASIEDAAAVLEELLGSGFAVWDDGSLYSIKQLVARVQGLQIHIYSREHAPPHFHVIGSGVDATFTVQEGAFLDGTIDGRQRRLIEWWYDKARSQVIKAWNDTRPGDCQVGALPVESWSNPSLERP